MDGRLFAAAAQQVICNMRRACHEQTWQKACYVGWVVKRSTMIAFVAVTLFASQLWGSCASCVPFFSGDKTGNGCCMPSGQCKTPVRTPVSHQHCKSAGTVLEQYVQADAGQLLDTPGALCVEILPAAASEPLIREEHLPPPLLLQSPPDLVRLYSAFLI